MSNAAITETDLFDDTDFGITHRLPFYKAAFKDSICDAYLALSPKLRRIDASVKSGPRYKVLIVGVQVPKRGDALAAIARDLAQSKYHECEISTVCMQPKSQFENVLDATDRAKYPLSLYDYLVITDDDVHLPSRTLDRYLSIVSSANLIISQPAHRFDSFASWAVTRRKKFSIARLTECVETGPVTVFAAEAFSAIIPFPKSKYCWGVDLIWTKYARDNNWRMGVVDAVALEHTSPVHASYSKGEATAEALQLLRERGIDYKGQDVLRTLGPAI